MLAALQDILEGALQRLSYQIHTYLPGLLAAITILLGAYIVARTARWLLNKIFRGMALDRFLRESGLSTLLSRSGRVRATRLVAETAYWIILLLGLLTGLSAFNTELTTHMIETVLFLLPKLVTATAIILAGVWLGQYLGRSVLVWAVNEGIPSGRRLGTAVRIVIVFAAVVVASDQLNFARSIFLATFVMAIGGAILAISLALGLEGREWLHHYLKEREAATEEPVERSLRNHL